MLVRVERDLAHREWRCAFDAGAAQQRLDAGEEGARTEGLVEVVVGAELQRPHQILLFAAYGEHHDGNARFDADRLTDLKAARARHIDIEHDEVRRLLFEGAYRRRAVGCAHDEVARLRQCEGDEAEQIAIVVGDQDLHAATSAGRVMVKRVRFSGVRSAAIVPP